MPGIVEHQPTELDRLPSPIRDAIFDPHFSGSHSGSPISIRLTRDMERGLDVLSQRMNNMGGVDWLDTRSDFIRLGCWLVLALFNSCLENPPPELQAILTMDRLESNAKMMSLMREKMRKAIEIRSKQIGDMMRDPDADEEVRLLLTDLVREVNSLAGYWRTLWVKEVENDRMLAVALVKYNITFATKEEEPTE